MKFSVLIDETVKQFIGEHPDNKIVLAFIVAWQSFALHRDAESTTTLNKALDNLMKEAKGIAMLVCDDYGIDAFNDAEDQSYDNVTFH